MPKLPAYVFRRPNGSYRYKRKVLKRLRHLIGKDTLYRQLGESYSEAMNALPKAHSEIEGMFAAEETMPADERALPFIKAAFGEEVAELVSAGQVAEYSHENPALNELAQTIAGKLPEEVVRQFYNGNGLGEKPRLDLFSDIIPDAKKITDRVMQEIGFGETCKDNAVDVAALVSN